MCLAWEPRMFFEWDARLCWDLRGTRSLIRPIGWVPWEMVFVCWKGTFKKPWKESVTHLHLDSYCAVLLNNLPTAALKRRHRCFSWWPRGLVRALRCWWKGMKSPVFGKEEGKKKSLCTSCTHLKGGSDFSWWWKSHLWRSTSFSHHESHTLGHAEKEASLLMFLEGSRLQYHLPWSVRVPVMTMTAQI